MKRSAQGEQTLDMNAIDFERATGGKKIKLNFSAVTLNNGRISYDKKHSALANDLVLVLQESKPAEILMQYQQFNFSMNAACQLTISKSAEVVAT